MDIFTTICAKFSDKNKLGYKENYNAGKDYIQNMNKWLCYDISCILKNMLNVNNTKYEKEYAYKLLIVLIKTCPKQISVSMSELIPIIINDTNSSIKEVKEKAIKCLEQLLYCSGNDDLNPFIPIVLNAITIPLSSL